MKNFSNNSKENIETVLKNGNIGLINKDPSIARVFIPPNHYFSSRTFRYLQMTVTDQRRNFKNLCISLYKQVYPKKTVNEKSVETQFKRVFNNKDKSYLGYEIVACKNITELNDMKRPKGGFAVLNSTLEKNTSLNAKLSVSYLLNQITNFYKTLLPKDLSTWLAFLRQCNFKELGQKTNDTTIQPVSESFSSNELRDFATFSTQSDIIGYLKKSPSIYHKMCLFFSQNPITRDWSKKNNITCEEHHVFPLYLARSNAGFDSINLNARFNIIYVPCFIHVFLHGLRFLEFGFIQDLQSAKILYYSLRKKETENSSQSELADSQKSFNDERFLVSLFTDSNKWTSNPNFAKQLYSNQMVLNQLKKRQNAISRSTYEDKMIWQNAHYKNMPSLIVPPNTVQLHTQMAGLLIQHLEVYLNKNPHCQKPFGWDNRSIKIQSGSISKYINQKQFKGLTCWGFYLRTNEKRLMASRQTSFVQKSQKNSSAKTLSFLKLGGYQWINRKYQKQLMVEAGKYQTFSQMVYDLIELLPLDDRPKNWKNPLKSGSLVNGSVINKFRQVQRGIYKTSYKGWILQKFD